MQVQSSPIAIKSLQPELVRLVKKLHTDLRERCDELQEVGAPLQEEYQRALEARRTQETFQAWRENVLDQVAVAWVLATGFVRFLEDNLLIDECWLASDDKARRGEARERYTAFFKSHPECSDRDFFHHVFDQVATLPGCADLFGRDRNPLWQVGISGDGAKLLREFFAEVDPASGALLRSFVSEDTRFLGDLYQNLSEDAQKKYALLQTPDFVEEFILDRTLTPALGEFGLEQTKIIDPTCGSGHFLLGAFQRLFLAWLDREPSENPRLLARKALEAVHGVDINPFAVAIARFRLMIAFVKACSFTRLAEMPFAKIHVATGDSLLHGNQICSARGWGTQELSDWLPDVFSAGDFQDACEILSKKYEVVVGNPPYIVNRDKANNEAIRVRYKTAYRQYSLAVPFKEKFWDLAVAANGPQRAGYVGMITANSFMKREFGSKVIEEFFPQVDLTHVLDTSGAYIPGHGTPTVILLGRNRRPVLPNVRAVLGIRGEPSTPAEPAQGQVWRSILDLIDQPGEQSAFVSATDVDRKTFAKHPWSIGGGGASELKERIEREAAKSLSAFVTDIGRTTVVGEDDIWTSSKSCLTRRNLADMAVEFIIGENVRDYSLHGDCWCIYPYLGLGGSVVEKMDHSLHLALWPYRRLLEGRTVFGKTLKDRNEPYWVHLEHYTSKLKTPLSITFAEVATHNHFVLDRGGKVFKQTAPVIKLPATASEDDHLALLGLLTSSTACFWLKQVCFPKGGNSDSHGWALSADDPWDRPFQFNATNLQSFPLPEGRLLDQSKMIAMLAEKNAELFYCLVQTLGQQTRDSLNTSATEIGTNYSKMIFLQEELDWAAYGLYGILTDPPVFTVDLDTVLEIQMGQRAFEIVLAREIASGESNSAWFRRHRSTPITERPVEWPADYRAVVEARLQLIASHPEIALLEKPEHKRRWQQRPWDERVQEALVHWLGDRIEEELKKESQLISCARLADRLSHDPPFMNALSLYRNSDDLDLTREVVALCEKQQVPYLAAWRYSEAGLRILADWEATWDLQRAQDAGQEVGDIPVPPKYGQKDFLKSEYWSLRGKLDVPKERFISYPNCQRDSDQSPIIGCAGWNHQQRASALATYLVERIEQDGWEPQRQIPLLAGLAELIPWLKQWHNHIDPDTGERLGDYFEIYLTEQLRDLNLTRQDLANWRPPAKVAKAAKAPKKEKAK